jgi:predicted TIM-barrel fold metal-dependent hydrolase
MGFMSDIIRGTPLTQTGSSIYQAPPTLMQNAMSLGLGAYGLNQLGIGKAEGGEVKSYARGGISDSVMSPEFKRYAVDHIDPRQLPLAQRNAVMRGDRETADFATDEMLVDAAIRRGAGLAAAFTPQMADHVVRAAGGGILAFAEGGTKKAPTTMQQAIESLYSTELPELDRGPKYVESVKGIRGGLEGLYPASEAIPIYQQTIEKQQARLPEIEKQARGLTALRMAAALQKAGVTSGDRYAGMFEAAASGAEKAQALRDAANSELNKSMLLMAQAKDSRAMGLTDKALSEKSASEAHAERAAKFKQDADKQMVQILGQKEIHAADRAAQLAAANRPGETERMLAEYENRIGRKLSPEEYTEAIANLGAARFGVRYTGQKGEFEHKAKVDELIQKDKRFENISLDLMRAGGRKDAKSTALRDDANARLAELRKEYEDRYKIISPVAGLRAPTDGAQTPPLQAIEALRANPSRRDEFDAKYGRGASARYLGE